MSNPFYDITRVSDVVNSLLRHQVEAKAGLEEFGPYLQASMGGFSIHIGEFCVFDTEADSYEKLSDHFCLDRLRRQLVPYAKLLAYCFKTPDLELAKVQDELVECRRIVREFWEWQNTVQDLLPDGLADRVIAMLSRPDR